MSKETKLMTLVQNGVFGGQPSALRQRKALVAPNPTMPDEANARAEAKADEAKDRAALEEMKKASVEKFISMFGKGSKLQEAAFLE